MWGHDRVDGDENLQKLVALDAGSRKKNCRTIITKAAALACGLGLLMPDAPSSRFTRKFLWIALSARVTCSAD